jgi:hypothetical protein
VTPRRVAAGGFDLALALTLGAAARLAHVLWYRLFETSVVVASGDRVLGPAGDTADSRAWRPRRVAAAGAVGFLLHASIAPAFTPFGLEPGGVNAVLTAGGVAVGLWSFAVRRATR